MNTSKPLPPNSNPSFVADYALASVYAAHRSNYDEGPAPASIAGVCLHTPEEDADDTESTPVYFAGANRQASVNYYMDSDGDVIQCVSEADMPYANGVVGKPYPAWADPNQNLNWQTVSIEIEGRAANIQDTLVIGGPQWNGLVALICDRCTFYNIPMDREHIIGHYQVSTARTDPGAHFPWADLMTALAQEDSVTTEEQRKLDDREARVVLDWLGVQHYNYRLNRDTSMLVVYDPVGGAAVATIPIPSFPPTV